jgi:hypothetical protein
MPQLTHSLGLMGSVLGKPDEVHSHLVLLVRTRAKVFFARLDPTLGVMKGLYGQLGNEGIVERRLPIGMGKKGGDGVGEVDGREHEQDALDMVVGAADARRPDNRGAYGDGDIC